MTSKIDPRAVRVKIMVLLFLLLSLNTEIRPGLHFVCRPPATDHTSSYLDCISSVGHWPPAAHLTPSLLMHETPNPNMKPTKRKKMLCISFGYYRKSDNAILLLLLCLIPERKVKSAKSNTMHSHFHHLVEPCHNLTLMLLIFSDYSSFI